MKNQKCYGIAKAFSLSGLLFGLMLSMIAFNQDVRANEAHDKFVVLNVKLGMLTEKQPGFVCTKERWTQSKVRVEPQCVKFVDDRCKGKPASIGFLRYGQNAPKGCHYDPSSTATRLDNVIMQDPHTGATDQPRNGRKPLNNIAIFGTKAEPSKIYRIKYMLAEDNLKSTDSKIYKALVGKYGEPTYPEHSGKVTWKKDGAELVAYCQPYANCEITVQDRNFEDMENKAQEEIDAKKKSDSAPAPAL